MFVQAVLVEIFVRWVLEGGRHGVPLPCQLNARPLISCGRRLPYVTSRYKISGLKVPPWDYDRPSLNRNILLNFAGFEV